MVFVNVAILSEQRVLLTRREDFDVWCLPGGHVEPGQSLVDAAHREVREETGLEIQIEHLVGMYSRPRWLDGTYHLALFRAIQIGGTLEHSPARSASLPSSHLMRFRPTCSWVSARGSPMPARARAA